MKTIIGKTILKVEYRKSEIRDDEPLIIITFTDGSEVGFEGGYGGYTGRSEDEYPSYVWLLNDEELEELKEKYKIAHNISE